MRQRRIRVLALSCLLALSVSVPVVAAPTRNGGGGEPGLVRVIQHMTRFVVHILDQIVVPKP